MTKPEGTFEYKGYDYTLEATQGKGDPSQYETTIWQGETLVHESQSEPVYKSSKEAHRAGEAYVKKWIDETSNIDRVRGVFDQAQRRIEEIEEVVVNQAQKAPGCVDVQIRRAGQGEWRQLPPVDLIDLLDGEDPVRWAEDLLRQVLIQN